MTPINFFKDKNGKTVIIQKPNLYIWLAVGLYLTKFLFEDSLNNIFSLVINIVLFAWAVDEVVRGDSPFRRVLGFCVGLLIIAVIIRSI